MIPSINAYTIIAASTLLVFVVWIIVRCCCSNGSIPNLELKKYKYDLEGYIPLSFGPSYPKADDFVNHRGKRIRCFSYPARSKSGSTDKLGVILFCPELGAHANFYRNYARANSEMGFDVYSMDYEGFGESEGAQGDLASFEHTIRDVLQFFALIRLRHANTPIFAAGHGFGASIVLACGLREPTIWAGLVLYSPDLLMSGHSKMNRFASLVAPWLPWLRIAPNPIDLYSRNMAVAKEIWRDPLFMKRRFTARTTRQLSLLRAQLNREMATLNVAFLLAQGLQDIVCDSDGARNLWNTATSVSKDARALVTFPRCWHDLLHELEWEEAVQQGVEWMSERVKWSKLCVTLD